MNFRFGLKKITARVQWARRGSGPASNSTNMHIGDGVISKVNAAENARYMWWSRMRSHFVMRMITASARIAAETILG